MNMRKLESFSIMYPCDSITDYLTMQLIQHDFGFDGEVLSWDELNEKQKSIVFLQACNEMIPECIFERLRTSISVKSVKESAERAMSNCFQNENVKGYLDILFAVAMNGKYETSECGFLLEVNIYSDEEMAVAPVTSLYSFHYDENGEVVKDVPIFEGSITRVIASPLFRGNGVSLSYKSVDLKRMTEGE